MDRHTRTQYRARSECNTYNDRCQKWHFDACHWYLLNVHPHAIKLLPRLLEVSNVSDGETARVLREEVNVQSLLCIEALNLFNVFHQSLHLFDNCANLLREFCCQRYVRVLLGIEVIVNHRVVIVQLLRHICNVLRQLVCDCIALHCTLPHFVVAV